MEIPHLIEPQLYYPIDLPRCEIIPARSSLLSVLQDIVECFAKCQLD